MITEEIAMITGDITTTEEGTTTTRDTREEEEDTMTTEVTEETDTDRMVAERATDQETGTIEATRRMTRRPVLSLSRRSRWTGGSQEKVSWHRRVQEDTKTRADLAKSRGSSRAPSSRSSRRTFSWLPLTAPANHPAAPLPG